VDETLHRARGGESRQGREKRRRRTEAGLEPRDEVRRDHRSVSRGGTTGTDRRREPPAETGGRHRTGKWIPRAGSAEGAHDPTGGCPEQGSDHRRSPPGEGPDRGRGPRGCVQGHGWYPDFAGNSGAGDPVEHARVQVERPRT